MEPHDHAEGYLGERSQAILTRSQAERLATGRLCAPVGSNRSRSSPSLARALERGERAIDAGDHLFFSENFEQMIEAWPHVAAGHSQSSRMNDRADFYAEVCGGAFQCRFDFSNIEFLQRTQTPREPPFSFGLFSAVKCLATPSGLYSKSSVK